MALFAGAVGCYLYSRFDRRSDGPRWQPLRLTDAQIGFVFTLLGITAFSTVVALGLLVARAIMPLDAARPSRSTTWRSCSSDYRFCLP